MLGALAAIAARGQNPDVRIAGTLSNKPLLIELVHAIKAKKGLQIAFTTDLTSVQAVDAVANEKVDIALITRALTGEDRASYPAVNLNTIPVGMEVVALGVSGDLWDAGVKTITKETMRAIYEQKITNWKDAGGPDEKITLFNFEQGLGVWEMFAEWLYGDNRKAPLPKVEIMGSSKDARDSLEFTPGAIAPLAAPVVDGVRCHALAIDLGERLAKPVPEVVASGTYPIVRPINAVTIDRPALAIRAVTEFLTGKEGQALLNKCGDMGLDAVPKKKSNPYF